MYNSIYIYNISYHEFPISHIGQKPKQQIAMHVEHLGRRAIAALTVSRKNDKVRKISKVQPDPQPASYIRKPLAFDELDNVGCGIPMAEDQHYRAAAIRKASERRFSDAASPPHYVPQKRKPHVEDNSMEDIYGSVGTPGAGKVKVSTPHAPTYGPSAVRVAVPVAPSLPTAPRATQPAAVESETLYGFDDTPPVFSSSGTDSMYGDENPLPPMNISSQRRKYTQSADLYKKEKSNPLCYLLFLSLSLYIYIYIQRMRVPPINGVTL